MQFLNKRERVYMMDGWLGGSMYDFCKLQIAGSRGEDLFM